MVLVVLTSCLSACLSAQESPQDSAITRDINRTFPAHDYFKDTGGDGQDSLYKICKVGSVFQVIQPHDGAGDWW